MSKKKNSKKETQIRIKLIINSNFKLLSEITLKMHAINIK